MTLLLPFGAASKGPDNAEAIDNVIFYDVGDVLNCFPPNFLRRYDLDIIEPLVRVIALLRCFFFAVSQYGGTGVVGSQRK